MILFGANGSTHARAKYAGNGVLAVRAIHAANINEVSGYSYDGDRVGTVIAKALEFAPQDLGNGSYVEGGTLLEAFCSTICCDRFADPWFPPHPNHPERKGCVEEMLRWTKNPEKPVHLHSTSDRVFNIWLYAGEVRGACQGHAFITTEKGHFGLAPTAAESGDQLWFVFGCRMPLLLRSVKDDRFRLVGETFIQGLMDGEPLLGRLPHSYRPVRRDDDVENSLGFLDVSTKEFRYEDPRLELFPLGTYSDEEYNDILHRRVEDPRQTPEALTKRGVKVQSLNLV